LIVSKRHKRTGLKTRVVRKITDIDAAEWKSVFPDVLESYEFLKTLDECNLEQFSLYYIMVYKGRAPVGATACFLVNYSLDTSISGPLRRISNSIKKAVPNIFSIKAFVCGMPIGQGRIGVIGDRDEVVKAILRRIEQAAKKLRASIVAFKDFDSTYDDMLSPLKKAGFTKFESLPTTELEVRFRDFEDYLKTLSGATRYDLRRKFKKVSGLEPVRLEIVDSLNEGMLDDVYRLYLDIVAKNEMNFELLPKDFFRKISENMPGRAKFFLYRIDGVLGAFLFCLISKEMFIDYYVGLNYSVAHKYHLYFIKFRDVLNWCIKHGIKTYEMGMTSYEPKRRLGFSLVPLYLYVKLRNRALRPVFNFICQFLKFENFDPELRKSKRLMAS
jgi:predicted N-acyltransferase